MAQYHRFLNIRCEDAKCWYQDIDVLNDVVFGPPQGDYSLSMAIAENNLTTPHTYILCVECEHVPADLLARYPNDKLIGMIVYRPGFAGQFEVLNACVEPRHRRAGIMTDILKYLHELNPDGFFFGTVRKNNRVARALYRSLQCTEHEISDDPDGLSIQFDPPSSDDSVQ